MSKIPTTQEDFTKAIEEIKAAAVKFATGNYTTFKAFWSHAEDVTIFGGWGAWERGWEQVGPRIDWAAARYRGGHTEIEVISLGTSGSLGYTIWIEKGDALMEGFDEFRPIYLRVTQLYRQEEGGWKVIHRHADPIKLKTAPGAILQ